MKTKSEAEFGVDLAFLSPDRNRLTIFVLKDEALTNRTWTANGFYEDLCKAVTPDLSAEGLDSVNVVEVILAYNRDEEANGVTLFERFVAAAALKIAERATLSISRWNLSELVELTLAHLLTPALLPQEFFGQLNYLCSQFADFPHGSDEWEQQLVPAWKRFLNDVLAQDPSVRGVSLVPVALIIMRQHGAANETLETGWIDIIEWSAIAMWRKFSESDDATTRGTVVVFWEKFYLDELERFYRAHIDALATEHAIDQIAHGSMVGVVAASAIAYWHLGRLGILSLGLSQLISEEGKAKTAQRREALNDVANWTVRVFNTNDAALRPLLDIHHIELGLLPITFSNANRLADLGPIFLELIQRLCLRRVEIGEIPFPDGYNSLENVFEQVASGNREKLVMAQSSFLVLMLMEMCLLFGKADRDSLVAMIHRRLVLGDTGSPRSQETKPLTLISWIPPEGWDTRILKGPVEDGDVITCGPFSNDPDATAEQIILAMKSLVNKMRATGRQPDKLAIPLGPLVLASIRHKSPLIPEVWRAAAFPE
jgi:hypothetical protein